MHVSIRSIPLHSSNESDALLYSRVREPCDCRMCGSRSPAQQRQTEHEEACSSRLAANKSITFCSYTSIRSTLCFRWGFVLPPDRKYEMGILMLLSYPANQCPLQNAITHIPCFFCDAVSISPCLPYEMKFAHKPTRSMCLCASGLQSHSKLSRPMCILNGNHPPGSSFPYP